MKKINSTKELGMVVSGNLYKIYDPLISYYVMHTDIAIVDNEIFHRFPEYDLDSNITLYKPLYIDYDDSDVWEHRLENKKYRISEGVLQNYEKISRYLWQRKNTLSQ